MNKVLTRSEYFVKNYWFPTLTLSIILAAAITGWIKGEVGGMFITIFVLTCLIVMVALGLRSYNNYKDFVDSVYPAEKYDTPTSPVKKKKYYKRPYGKSTRKNT